MICLAMVTFFSESSGMPSLKILDYTIRDMTPANGPVAASPAPTINAQDYALRTDLDALAAQITAVVLFFMVLGLF